MTGEPYLAKFHNHAGNSIKAESPSEITLKKTKITASIKFKSSEKTEKKFFINDIKPLKIPHKIER